MPYVNGFVFVDAVPFRYQLPLFYGGVPKHIQRQRRSSDSTDRVRLLTFRHTVQLGTELVDSRSPIVRFWSSYTWKWLTHPRRRGAQAWGLTLKGECSKGADTRNVQETRFLLTADITFQLQGEGCRVSLQGPTGSVWAGNGHRKTFKRNCRGLLVAVALALPASCSLSFAFSSPPPFVSPVFPWK